ncbi:hypothetical protein ACTJLF_08400, partial [Variovorax sp. 22077]
RVGQYSMEIAGQDCMEINNQELDHINAAVDLHEFQLKRLSYSEVSRAVKKAAGEIRSTGGRVVTPAAQQADMLQEAP